jgi:hypothetical protein
MVANANYFCVSRGLESLSAESRVLGAGHKAALLKDSRWQTGDQITIRFLDGDPALQARVKAVALEWTRVANLNFVFMSQEPTDVRISFTPGNGSWSYIGTVCRQIPEPQPTMNFGWLTPGSDDTELRRVVLHEFGHAVGLIHEHQNPKGGIPWNRAAVIHDLSGPPNNWNEATIETNIFHFYPPTDVVATDVDSRSIMMYPIPAAWTMNGFSAGLNGELSDNDKGLVGTQYPR